jgi:hypothetical protein
METKGGAGTMQLSDETKRRYLAELAETMSHFSNEELAWDFHCNVSAETRKIIASEARKRNVDLCAIDQIRRSGPIVPGAEFFRMPCGGCRR